MVEETTPAIRHSAREWLERLAPAQVEFPDEVVDGLKAITLLTGRDAEWWLNRLLFIALKGRLQLEEIEPLRYKLGASEIPSDFRRLEPLRISTHLTDVLASSAFRADLRKDEFLFTIIRSSIFGVSSSDTSHVPPRFDGPDEASLKIWLPVSVHTAVTQLASHWSLSVSDVLRNLLLEHLVGRLGLLRIVGSGHWMLRRRHKSSDGVEEIMFSKRQVADDEFRRRSYGVATFGKSTVNIKLWCPFVLRDGLAQAATSHGLPLSDYVRLVTTGYVFGQLVTSPIVGK